MNLIKKILALSGALSLGASSTAAVVACGPENTDLQILLVDGKDSLELNKAMKELGNLIQDGLTKKGFNKKVALQLVSYDEAASSITSGNSALAFLPILSYYEYSIKNDLNVMHQLIDSTLPALWSEYDTAAGEVGSSEKLVQMNKNGFESNMEIDQTNVFNLVMESSDKNKAEQISTKPEDKLYSSYYRGYQYISKVTLKKYRDQALNDPLIPDDLKQAWQNLVMLQSDKYAIFAKNNQANETNLKGYWKIVWDIYERATKDKGIGLAKAKTSGAGRISPIWTMLEAYLLANSKTLNTETLKEAEKAVKDLLDGNFKELESFNTTSLTELMTSKNAERISVGVGFADVRIDYNIKDKDGYTIDDLMDELTIFTSSHGNINNGVVYSTRFFKNKLDLLKAIQDTFVDLIDNNSQAKTIFYDSFGYMSFHPIDIYDNKEIQEYENKIKSSQNHIIRNEAGKISYAIKPA